MNFLVVAGPTASGKSALALELARQLDGEIVSCDSVQVYRGFNLGAAKPDAAEQAEIPHHLIDIVDWNQDYDAAQFGRDARRSIEDILSRGRLPVLAGGTGLYLRALLQQAFHDDLPSDENLRAALKLEDPDRLYARLVQLDPVRAAQIHPHDLFRVTRAVELNMLLGGPVHEKTSQKINTTDDGALIVVLDPDRKSLHERISGRTRKMLESGLVEEVRALIARGIAPDCKPMQSIGYKQCAAHLAGEIPEIELEEKISAATRQYAKRQCTWFKKTRADIRLQERDPDIRQLVTRIRKSIP